MKERIWIKGYISFVHYSLEQHGHWALILHMTLEVPVTLEHLSNKEEAHAALYDIDDESSENDENDEGG